LSNANAVEIGQWLQGQRKTLGIAPAPLLLAIGRDKVILKDLKFPIVAAHEEPALVRFQTIRELAESPEDIVIDYCRQTGQPGDTERRGLAVVLRRDLLRSINLMAEAAGLKLLGITPRPFGLLASLEETARSGGLSGPDPQEGTIALLARGEKWGEFSIAKQGQIVFSRALGLPSLNSETALLGEVKRNLAMFNSQNANADVQGLYIAESATPAWSGRLREGLTIPVHPFDPVAGTSIDPKWVGNFAALIGLVAKHGRDNELPINFSQPREPKPPRDPNTRLVAVAAALMAVVFLGLVGWGISVQLQKDEVIAQLNEQKATYDRELTRLEPQAKRLKAIDEWTNREVVWIDEFYELTARFPDIERTRLVQFFGDPLPISKNAAENKYVARMSLKVVTEDGKSVDALLGALVKDGHYRVAPKEPRGNTGFRGSRFNQSYGIRADVMHRTPKEYLSLLKSKRPGSKTGRGDGEAGLEFGGGGSFDIGGKE